MDTWDDRVEEIKGKAYSVLRDASISSPPIPSRKVAEGLGIEVRSSELGEGVSGLLTLEGGTPTIGYDKRHPNVRQQFTIAHETGHYVLHKDQTELFIVLGECKRAIKLPDSSGRYEPVGSGPSRLATRAVHVAPITKAGHQLSSENVPSG